MAVYKVTAKIVLDAKKCAINAKGVVAYEENQAIFIMNAQIASEPRTANITSEFLLCCVSRTSCIAALLLLEGTPQHRRSVCVGISGRHQLAPLYHRYHNGKLLKKILYFGSFASSVQFFLWVFHAFFWCSSQQ